MPSQCYHAGMYLWFLDPWSRSACCDTPMCAAVVLRHCCYLCYLKVPEDGERLRKSISDDGPLEGSSVIACADAEVRKGIFLNIFRPWTTGCRGSRTPGL